jgi:hypothetical protein
MSGWSAPFSKRVFDSWAARSKEVGSAERAETVRRNILDISGFRKASENEAQSSAASQRGNSEKRSRAPKSA